MFCQMAWEDVEWDTEVSLVNGTVKVCVPYDHSLEYHPGGCLHFMFI